MSQFNEGKMIKRIDRHRGYTLLEYCAGAALLLAIVWGGMQTLGTDMRNYLVNVGEFLRGTALPNSPGGDSSDGQN